MRYALPPRHRGFTLIDLVALLVGIVLLAVIAIPTLGAGRTTSGVQQSMSNITLLGLAHALYGMNHNDRQLTHVVDDIASYGEDGDEAFSEYRSEHYEFGDPSTAHPDMLAGWGTDTSGAGPYLFRYVLNGTFPAHEDWAGSPINFPETGILAGFGWFRLANLRLLHSYVGGRWYDPTFYAPNDSVPYAWAEPFFDHPWEVVDVSISGGTHAWTSYVLSPAALFNPEVMRHPDAGGWQNPWSLDYGLQTPNFSAALYPNLKTQFMEHHWLQNAPADQCNPHYFGGTYSGCEPYYFNHSLASEPVTLFYDMSVRLLPNTEVKAADDQLIAQTGYGLWSRDTTFGIDGYFNTLAHDPVGLSHHILTTDGIRGRDTLDGVIRSRRHTSNPAKGRAHGLTNTPLPQPFDRQDKRLLLQHE